MKGKIIAAEEVKARWGYAEVNSERFGQTYKANLPPDVFRAAKDGVAFDQLAAADHPALVAALKNARPAEFVDNIDQWGAPRYECVEWLPNDLLNSITIPVFDCIPYFAFLARPPKMDAQGNPDNGDPRHASHRIPFNQNFEPMEPLIAISINGHHMLLEGYLRSILWLRQPTNPLLVWVPKAAA